MVFRAVSWNIKFGIEVPTAIEVLTTHPDLRGAEIVCLQEMDEEGARAVSEALGLNYFFGLGSVHPQTDRPFGNAVLAAWDLDHTGVLRLPHKARFRGQDRIGVHAQLQLEHGPLTVCSVHTEIPTLGPSKRTAQYDELAAAGSQWSHAALIAGDFNTISARQSARLVERMGDRGFSSASSGTGPTLRRLRMRYTLDHIFIRGLRRLDAGVAVESPGSDHDPVWVTLARHNDSSG